MLKEDGTQDLTGGSAWRAFLDVVQWGTSVLIVLSMEYFEFVSFERVILLTFLRESEIAHLIWQEIDHYKGKNLLFKEPFLHVSAVVVSALSDGVEVKVFSSLQKVLLGLDQISVIVVFLVSMREENGIHCRHHVFHVIRWKLVHQFVAEDLYNEGYDTFVHFGLA